MTRVVTTALFAVSGGLIGGIWVALAHALIRDGQWYVLIGASCGAIIAGVYAWMRIDR